MKKALSSREKCRELLTTYYSGMPSWTVMLDAEIKKYLPAERVLDAGCGKDAAHISKYLGMIKEPYGVDLVDIAADQKIKAYKCSIEKIPAESDYFDLIMCNSVAEHLEDPLAVLKEFYRVLKPGGRLIFFAPNKFHYSSIVARCTPQWFHKFMVQKISGEDAYDTFPVYYKLNSVKDFTRLSELSGLGVQQIKGVRNYPYYLMFSVILFRLGVGFEKLTESWNLNFLNSSLLVTLYKPGR
jgi:ubiquinone/menaquinone biosynthesis C-methylase UbiE